MAPGGPDAPAPNPQIEALELRLLAQALEAVSGLEFGHYAPASLKRRVRARVQAEGLATISELQARVLRDPACLERLIEGLTIHVTAMFRDPDFFAAFRAQAVPLLRSWPRLRLWVAGCASGEEAYSLAIVLAEEGLAAHARIYATDVSARVLQAAQAGIMPVAAMKDYTENYIRAGGTRSFSEYYTSSHQHALLHSELRKIITFGVHNLATDSSFQECQAILCRNVMIYFDRELQARVHELLWKSLSPGGVLALGSAETIRFSAHEDAYEALDARARLYRRVPPRRARRPETPR